MFRIKKAAPNMTPRAYFIRKAKKSKAGKDALAKLNDYLNANTPEPMYWLHSMWKNQQNAITYKELREAIQNGYLDLDTLRAWQEDYAKLVSKKIFPGWFDAIAAGAQNASADATNFGVLATAQWVADHGAELVTVISDEARQAIQALVGVTVNGQYTVDELSRAIRPLVGLTRPQAAANLKYYTKVRDTLLEQNPTMKKATAEKRAQEAAMKYASRQHRYRAQMIAETETAKAYTQGYRGYVRQEIQNGALRPGVMVWDTAQDEAVCPVCGALNGQESDEKFTFRLNGKTYDGPPAHPRCRCAEHFEERGEGAAPGGYTQAPWGASGVPGRPGVSPADPYSMTIQTKPEEIGGDGWREICRETHILRENGVDYEVTIVSENYNGTLAFRNRVDVKPAGFRDVTEEYLKRATPGVGSITFEPGYDMGRDHAQERAAAQWLHDTLGGDVTVLKEINKNHIKTPDFFWAGALWDLKNPTTAQAANSAVRHGLSQIRSDPGGVILDYTDADVNIEEAIGAVQKRMQWDKNTPVDIMLIKHGVLKYVLRFNEIRDIKKSAPPPNSKGSLLMRSPAPGHTSQDKTPQQHYTQSPGICNRIFQIFRRTSS